MFAITRTCRAPPAGLAVWWFSALRFSGYCINTKTKTTSKTPVPSILPIQNGVRGIAAEIFHQSYQQRYGLHTQHINSGRCEIQALEFKYQSHVETSNTEHAEFTYERKATWLLHTIQLLMSWAVLQSTVSQFLLLHAF